MVPVNNKDDSEFYDSDDMEENITRPRNRAFTHSEIHVDVDDTAETK